MKLKLLVWLLIFLAVPIGARQLPWFKIKKIDCRLNHYSCPLNLEPELLKFIGTNIFSLDTAAASRQLVNFDPTLTDIDLVKHLPNRLEVDLVRRVPLVVIKPVATADPSQWRFLDKSGFVFPLPNFTGQSLPEVWWSEAVPLPDGESPASLNLAKLINTLAAYYVAFGRISRLPESVYLIATTAGPEAVLAADAEFAPRVASLQFILSNIKMGEPMPIKIDLKFDKPILTY